MPSAEPTPRDLGRTAAQRLLRTDPLSTASIDLIADKVMDAYAPGHRAEVLAEAKAAIEDPARRREVGDLLDWTVARDVLHRMIQKAGDKG